MREENLTKFAQIAKVDLLVEFPDGRLEIYGGMPDDNPICRDAAFKKKLLEKASSQDFPCLYRDDFQVYFACIRAGAAFIYIGPMCSMRLGSVEARQFYHSYGITEEDVRKLRFFTLQEILYITELIEETVNGTVFEETELLYKNGLASLKTENISREQDRFLVLEEDVDEDDETFRHTYREERKLLDAVRTGHTEEVLRLSRLLDGDAGRLAAKDINHWRNLAIIGITLCSRAAIDAGLSPQTAYRVSGYYIGKCDAEASVTKLMGLRDFAIRDLTDRVAERLKRKKTSSYTEACKTYISKHYREKIYLEDIAEELGVSPTYLSRVFKKDTEVRFQDYIVQVRAQKAANLLKYSDRSLSQIAQYVNFPSQSYMGKVFKTVFGMTPKEYRDRYAAAEWEN